MDFSRFVNPSDFKQLAHEENVLRSGDDFFEIIGGIPRFVESNNYAQAFGLQWKKFRSTQLDSYTKTDLTETRLKEAFGGSLDQLEGKIILEAGSGAGRFTEILLKYGAIVYSFDYSEAVEANYDNNMPNDRLTLFQANILNIPFADDMFDFVICLGVLQHTPSTEKSLKELIRVLKPDGNLVVDHYKHRLGFYLSLSFFWWFIIKKFKPTKQIKITDNLTKLFFPLHWFFRNIRVAQKIISRFSPMNFYYGKFHLPKDILFEWSRLDTHDYMTDQFKRLISKKELNKILVNSKCKNIEIEQVYQGWLARASK